MDNVISSLMGNRTKQVKGGNPQKSAEVDPDGQLARKFASLLDKEKGKADKKGNPSKSAVHEDPDKKAVKKEKANQQEHLKNMTRQKSRKRMMKMSPMLNYIYNLMYKDPNALSKLEKSSAGLDKNAVFKQYDVEYKALKQMLAKRGMKLSDLSYKQMSKLAQTKTKSSVESYLNELAKETKTKKPEKTEKKTLVEKGKENQARRAKGEDIPKPNVTAKSLKDALRTHESQLSDQARSLLNRKEVMDQIVKKIDIRALQNAKQMTMKLNPEYLGELKLMLKVEKDKMTAEFETTSREVKEIIDGSVKELVEVFDGKGMKLAGAKVKLVDKIE